MLSLAGFAQSRGLRAGRAQSGAPALPGPWSNLLDAARLTPGQVDSELFRCAEDVFLAVAHLHGHAVAGEHFDVEAERLHFLDEHRERLRNAGFRDVLALDDGFVDLDPAHDVV